MHKPISKSVLDACAEICILCTCKSMTKHLGAFFSFFTQDTSISSRSSLLHKNVFKYRENLFDGRENLLMLHRNSCNAKSYAASALHKVRTTHR